MRSSGVIMLRSIANLANRIADTTTAIAPTQAAPRTPNRLSQSNDGAAGSGGAGGRGIAGGIAGGLAGGLGGGIGGGGGAALPAGAAAAGGGGAAGAATGGATPAARTRLASESTRVSSAPRRS